MDAGAENQQLGKNHKQNKKQHNGNSRPAGYHLRPNTFFSARPRQHYFSLLAYRVVIFDFSLSFQKHQKNEGDGRREY